MPEGQPIREVEPNVPLADAVRQIFERRAVHGERKLIKDVYLQKFEQLVTTLPKEQRETTMVNIQRSIVSISGSLYEYGARFADFVRGALLWPMIKASDAFPKDKYYQMNLARAQAWGEFAMRTTKTATAERNAFRDHFLPTSFIGAEAVGAVGAYLGATYGGVKAGSIAGAAVGGVYGAAIGAVVGGAVGAAIPFAMRVKDALLGPPVMYYNLNKLPSQVASGAMSTGG